MEDGDDEGTISYTGDKRSENHRRRSGSVWGQESVNSSDQHSRTGTSGSFKRDRRSDSRDLGATGPITNAHLTSSGFATRGVAVMALNQQGFHESFSPLYSDRYARTVETVQELVKQYRGVIDMMHGDRFLISFNASRLNGQYVHRGLTCAHALASRLIALTSTGSRALQATTDKEDSCNSCFTIGVACGQATVGNLGSSSMLRYSIVGPVVSHAVALEERCRKLHRTHGSHVLTANSPTDAHHHAEIRPLDIALLKGQKIPSVVQEVIALRQFQGEAQHLGHLVASLQGVRRGRPYESQWPLGRSQSSRRHFPAAVPFFCVRGRTLPIGRDSNPRWC